jgi:hypothetical protein
LIEILLELNQTIINEMEQISFVHAGKYDVYQEVPHINPNAE